AIVETRILELEALLKNAEVVDENELSTEYVYVGCKVEIEDLDNKTKIEYKIVGSNESDPAKMKISDESPIGAALINKKNNEILKINVPNGVKNYKILRIFK
ncbi:MAG: GreA/GreB family elongation factor, partial [Firmicutes bacterium]|nr:GreA/GreB family elongation factor [Bacillota bacterium]